ncbi:hypothetical protein [Jiella avicenniae]|uniref:Uncharacterized protein n=1 Tax=Jiella avicenniae TaxID=2907202 RepID=A0A9X1P759_9HYPH|nr:hypothetical protein [Jiella avicenniae]MCE7031004.1 hypothetical protein [Jiella avicenniae]
MKPTDHYLPDEAYERLIASLLASQNPGPEHMHDRQTAIVSALADRAIWPASAKPEPALPPELLELVARTKASIADQPLEEPSVETGLGMTLRTLDDVESDLQSLLQCVEDPSDLLSAIAHVRCAKRSIDVVIDAETPQLRIVG